MWGALRSLKTRTPIYWGVDPVAKRGEMEGNEELMEWVCFKGLGDGLVLF